MNIIVEEYNRAINSIAPPKIVQCRKNDRLYNNEEVREAEREADEKLFKSIRSNEIENWREYKRAKNLFTKAVDRAKKMFFSDKLNSKKESDATMKRIAGRERAPASQNLY